MSSSTPLTVLTTSVIEPWVDYNGHMNVGYYNVAFDKATDALFDQLNIGASYVERESKSFFTLETHVAYLAEVLLNDPVRFEAQILGFDDKRLHLFFTMYHAEKHFLSATSEQMCLHVDLSSRRSAPMPAPVFERVASLGHQHQQLPKPEAAGKSIGMPKR